MKLILQIFHLLWMTLDWRISFVASFLLLYWVQRHLVTSALHLTLIRLILVQYRWSKYQAASLLQLSTLTLALQPTLIIHRFFLMLSQASPQIFYLVLPWQSRLLSHPARLTVQSPLQLFRSRAPYHNRILLLSYVLCWAVLGAPTMCLTFEQ